MFESVDHGIMPRLRDALELDVAMPGRISVEALVRSIQLWRSGRAVREQSMLDCMHGRSWSAIR